MCRVDHLAYNDAETAVHLVRWRTTRTFRGESMSSSSSASSSYEYRQEDEEEQGHDKLVRSAPF